MGRKHKKNGNYLRKWKHFSKKKKKRLIAKFVMWVISVVTEQLIAYALLKLLL